jgi:hypothetical protein
MNPHTMAGSDHPNLIFVFPDQLGATWLRCYGNPDVRTPNIDRFARQGILFERAYTFMQYRDLCIRRGPFKLIVGGDRCESIALYDLAADPYEQDNLIVRSARATVAAGLREELHAWLQDVLLRAGDTGEASEPLSVRQEKPMEAA